MKTSTGRDLYVAARNVPTIGYCHALQKNTGYRDFKIYSSYLLEITGDQMDVHFDMFQVQDRSSPRRFTDPIGGCWL